MAVTFRVLYRHNTFFQNITKPVKWNLRTHYPIRFSCNGIKNKNNILQNTLIIKDLRPTLLQPIPRCSNHNSANASGPPQEPEKKSGIIQRFKQMYKDYWYVLLPVHMTTSALWFGGFYYCVRRYLFVFVII